MFELPEIERRQPRSFTMKPSTYERIERLAALHGVSASRIVEALVTNFGPRLQEQVEKKLMAEQADKQEETI